MLPLLEFVPTGFATPGDVGSASPATATGVVIAGHVAEALAASSALKAVDAITSIDEQSVSEVAALGQYEMKLKTKSS